MNSGQFLAIDETIQIKHLLSTWIWLGITFVSMQLKWRTKLAQKEKQQCTICSHVLATWDW